MEREICGLRNHVAQLEQQLRENGKEPNTAEQQASSRNSSHNFGNQAAAAFAWETQSNATADTAGHTSARNTQPQEFRAPTGILPHARSAAYRGETYLGVAPADDLSPVKGMAMTLFNMTIDLGDCIQDESEDLLAWYMTYDAVIGSITGRQYSRDLGLAQLPDTYEECAVYYGHWNTLVHPCFPVLHKPDFEAVVSHHAKYHRVMSLTAR